MANTLSYETPTDLQPGLIERFDAPGRMTLIVHPNLPGFLTKAVILIGAVIFSALVFAGTIGSDVTATPAYAFFASVIGVVGFLVLWNSARTRVVFELRTDRLYATKVGPLARSQQLWARNTVSGIAVHKFRDSRDAQSTDPEWRYEIRVYSTYRGRNYLHLFLRDRDVGLLRAVANELRLEFGWPPREAGEETEDQLPKHS